MADFDSADCLSRVKSLAGRPSTDAAIADARWYALLEEAQDYYVRQFAVHIPYVMLSAPTTLTSADGGATYTFASSIYPLAVVIYEAANGRLLRPGAYWDANADYVWEGDKMRHTRGQTRTYANGPVAQYVAPAGTLDGSNEPTLMPSFARILMIYRAVAEFMRQGGYRDPGPFEQRERELAWGDPRAPGDTGIIGSLKLQNPFRGMAAFAQPGVWGFEYVAQVQGYTAL